jgi:hypothetical protein
MVTPNTPADDPADVGVGAPALAMGHRSLRFIISHVRCGVPVEHRLENAGFVLGIVLGAWTEFRRTIAMVVPLHGQTTDAFAVVAALPIVSCDFAKVFVHCD